MGFRSNIVEVIPKMAWKVGLCRGCRTSEGDAVVPSHREYDIIHLFVVVFCRRI